MLCDLMSSITQFAILGERCSGTNYLEHLIKANFDLKYTQAFGHKEYTNKLAHKHFFQFSNNYNDDECDTCLFICIVRDPIEWLCSLYDNPYHISKWMKSKGWESFLSFPFYSMYDDPEIDGKLYRKERMGDRHIYTHNKYINVFQARSTKCKFLMEDFPNLVKNCTFVNYEYIRDNPKEFVDNLTVRFKLPKNPKEFVPYIIYKGIQRKIFRKKIYIDTLSDNILENINDNLDWEIENRMRYYQNKKHII